MVNPDVRSSITHKERIKLLFDHFFLQTTSAIETAHMPALERVEKLSEDEDELAAIDFGVRWALESNKSINIHTDSRSSIEALRSARPRSAFVINVKKNFYMALLGLTYIYWVKAHVGKLGNEVEDRHGKLAILEEKQ
ncbi:hypothetical protein AVEN_76691-1 [Araneus ventricosus]|uniref:Uncharacterized protein n=1 Tax=Araneus ventricosus TaxID=182803 RepID=A0A4Y2BQI3_ARAVE|nr:hypothetical protein AVEN_76691-1 [Araneus ventricosus]